MSTFSIVPTVGALRAQPGPFAALTVYLIDLGAPFRWSLGSTATHDGFTTITSLAGGMQGAWLRVETPDAGDPLPDEDATIGVGGGYWRTLPLLTASHTLTLDPTNASLGMPLEVTRTSTDPYTYTLLNGGQSGGTLCVMPGGSEAFALAQFDGTDFVMRRSAIML